MGRLGGGPLGAQIAMSLGCTPELFYAHVIDTSIFNGSNLSSEIFHRKRQVTKGFLYGLDKESVLEKIELPKLNSCKHFQLLANGTKIPEMGVNNWSWLGILCGPESEVSDIIKYVRIKTGDGYETPKY
ncbi:MAG: hypothetical protein ACXVCY_11040 [Pseudobdellovibrionaceae bacterium]